MLAYRNLGIFQENVVNHFLEDCVRSAKPRQMTVTGEFQPRGGVYSSITASYSRRRR
jgi:7-cyano-7-deazaguanine reductase